MQFIIGDLMKFSLSTGRLLGWTLGLLTLALGAGSASGTVTVARVFSSHMVLQQSAAVKIWGAAAVGESVTVSANWPGSPSETTQADAGGRWQVTLKTPAAPASQPGYTVKVAGANTVTFTDVLLGEVWLLSGQSNMELPLMGWPSADPPAPVEGSSEAIVEANFPHIRLIIAGRKSASEEQADMTLNWTLSRWTACSPSTVGNFSALGYFFGRDLHQSIGVPVGLLMVAWGGSSCEAWTADADLELVKDFNGRGPFNSGSSQDNVSPGVLFKGMIAPLIPYTIAGVLWYQGETNVGRSSQLCQLFPAMIEGWRQRWGLGDFPFLFAQLAPYSGYGGTSLPEFWEAQASALSLPGSGMVTVIDVGDANNSHPGKKQIVGERFSRLARGVVYGQTQVATSGPLYRAMAVEGNQIRLWFDHVDGGLVAASGGLLGFEIAGENGSFVVATAVIDGENVVVSSPSVAAPTTARYAWQGVPTPSLYNGAGEPAPSFRTRPATYVASHFGRIERPKTVQSTGFFPLSGRLNDAEIQPFVGYGISLGLDFLSPDLDALRDIAATGSNWVRLVVHADDRLPATGQAAVLEAAVRRSLAFGMTPLLAFDTQGASSLQVAVDFWSQPAIVELLGRFERDVIVEAGFGWTRGSAFSWRTECIRTLGLIRAAGIRQTLALEGPSLSPIKGLFNLGTTVLNADSQTNVIFTLPLTSDWVDTATTAQRLQSLRAAQVPFYFNHLARSYAGIDNLPVEAAMEACAASGVGFCASSWRGDDPSVGDALDIRSPSDPATLTAWGQTVVLGDIGIAALARPTTASQNTFRYDLWRTTLAWHGADASPGADPDGDGWSNDLERIHGLNPLHADGRTATSVAARPGVAALTFQLGPAAARFGQLTLESSSDLLSWSGTPLVFDPTTGQWQWAGTTPSLTLEQRRDVEGNFQIILLRTNPSGAEFWRTQTGPSSDL